MMPFPINSAPAKTLPQLPVLVRGWADFARRAHALEVKNLRAANGKVAV